MKITRVWAMPNKWTFKIPPIYDLVHRYVGDGKGWIDPFAGMYSPAEFTNDLNPDSCAKLHMDAFDFIKVLDGKYEGCLFDPPYSIVQVTRSYAEIGKKSQLGFSSNGALDPTGSFKIVKDRIAQLIKFEGYAVCFGWSSSGFGKSRGFRLLEVLLVCHGGNHNDTICTVEQKIQGTL